MNLLAATKEFSKIIAKVTIGRTLECAEVKTLGWGTCTLYKYWPVILFRFKRIILAKHRSIFLIYTRTISVSMYGYLLFIPHHLQATVAIPTDEGLDIKTSTQWMDSAQGAVANLCGIPKTKYDVLFVLIHISLASLFRDLCKQCWPRSDAACLLTGNSIKIKSKYTNAPVTPKFGNGLVQLIGVEWSGVLSVTSY